MPDDIAPLISIALCTYNGARYLEKQLDSLFAQTYQNFEILAFDDCSSDNTVAILANYAKRDSRLRIEVNAINLGLRKNFENALRQCRGVYIAPCDQDDIWLPQKLAVLVDAIADHSVAFCDSAYVDGDGQMIGSRLSDIAAMSNTSDPAIFAFGNCVSGHAMLFKREILAHVPPVPEGFFYDWWLAAVAASFDTVVYRDECLVLYRQHANNVTDSLRLRIAKGADRPRGYRAKELREIGRRLNELAQLPGSHQAFLSKFRRLWDARESQWLSPALGLFMVTHRRRIFFIGKMRGLKLFRNALSFSIGLRFKRLTNQHAYD
jgi:glycosyltransferase involved in cell wall biosynthesis